MYFRQGKILFLGKTYLMKTRQFERNNGGGFGTEVSIKIGHFTS